jgi:outer membrane protein assembly factor BamB
MRLSAALGLAVCLAPVSAIFEDDAYHIDFHYALLGLPKHDATFFQKPYGGSKASLLYSISENQTIGAINPKDGALVWRQHPASEPRGKGHLRAADEQDTVVSAVGNRVTAWSSSDGRLVWETNVDGSVVEDLEILEQEDGITKDEAKDAVVLVSGTSHGVKRLDGKTGRIKWTYEDSSNDIPFQVSTSPTTIYYISLHSSIIGSGSKLKVTSLSPITGKKLDQYTLSSDTEISSRDHIVFAGANTAAPVLAWTDKDYKMLKVNIIGTKTVASFDTPGRSPIEQIVLHAPGHVNSQPHFLVEYQTYFGHSAEVFHVDLKKNSVSKAYSLPELQVKGTFAISTTDANVYFVRVTEDEVSVISSVSHGVLGRWPTARSPALAGAYPVHAASEVVVKSGVATAARSAVLFSNGQWVLIRNGDIAWTRPEFLAQASSAVWARLPEVEALAAELEVERHQNVVSAYIHRVMRHVQDLEYFPAWAQKLPQRLLGNVVGKPKQTTVDEIQQDTFGFHKLVIVATEKGRLAALDVGARGKVLWNVHLTQFADTIFEYPTLRAHSGYVEVKDPSFEGSLFINSTTGGTASYVNLHLHGPQVAEGQKLVSYTLSDGVLKGALQTEGQESTESVWTFEPPSGERIVGYTTRPLKDPVASIGKVLGDRRVLYKYLNPNLVLVTAVSELTRTASVYLLDTASGQLLHTMSHSDVDTSRPIPSTISENWFSYSLTIDSAGSPESRGHQLIVSDLYESPLPDDRGPLGASSNSSTVKPSSSQGDAAKPYVLSQSYQIASEISHMAVTQTRQGITSRELLITTPSTNSIVGIPRQVIDPRRPIGRDPTPNELAEGLTKYAPLLPLDSKWHLTHKYEVLGIKDVITSESGIESTSLVFAYGHDIFGTRVAPSFAFDILGKGFNKIQMLLTVAALFVGVLFVAPLVTRKQINSLWTIP